MKQGIEGRPGLEDRTFAVHSERSEAVERIRVLGEMDLSVVGLLDREMRRAEATDASKHRARPGRARVPGRLRHTAAARSQAALGDNGGRLRIRPATPQVRRVLELTGVGGTCPSTTDPHPPPPRQIPP